ncbi:MAG: hypothetical protein RBR69_01995, partial [Candidatus Cloacimonadaceae bacterium]|nr:hypothetical protein [Candidatus Cloacimonadaceae bacterium]
KTDRMRKLDSSIESFNPCFNGYMGKDTRTALGTAFGTAVSILVLMDTWVKTKIKELFPFPCHGFQSLF